MSFPQSVRLSVRVMLWSRKPLRIRHTDSRGSCLAQVYNPASIWLPPNDPPLGGQHMLFTMSIKRKQVHRTHTSQQCFRLSRSFLSSVRKSSFALIFHFFSRIHIYSLKFLWFHGFQSVKVTPRFFRAPDCFDLLSHLHTQQSSRIV